VASTGEPAPTAGAPRTAGATAGACAGVPTAAASAAVPLLPDYRGGCIANVVGALRCAHDDAPSWLPPGVAGAQQVVLLVLDGLGWEQLRERPLLAPCLSSMAGGPITSVVPTTTATALTSITTGLAPAAHEVVGYRVRVQIDAQGAPGGTARAVGADEGLRVEATPGNSRGAATAATEQGMSPVVGNGAERGAGPAPGEVLNVLRWRTGSGDARQRVLPTEFQRQPVFRGDRPPVVTRSEFASSGFTLAHLPAVRLHGWSMASSVPVTVAELLGAGEPFVYAYYDGLDKIAHGRGFGPYYDAELRAADRLVADVAGALPSGAVLLVTADHGQVFVGDSIVALPPDVMARTAMVSGEGRFRWLHARRGQLDRLLGDATAAFGHLAWVRTVDDLDAQGWFGGPLTVAGRSRLGDVALIAHQPVAFADPVDTGERSLRCRHGSVTSAEMLVPLVATRA